MKPEITKVSCQSTDGPRRFRGRHFVPLIAFASLALPSRARASLFHGETLDSIANGIAWVVLTRRRQASVWPRRPHAGPVVADDDDLGVEDPGKHQR
jgi:hypothetical protein